MRQWVRELREAEDAVLLGPDSEEEEALYDPGEHTSFHAVLAVYYLRHQGYMYDSDGSDPEFELWYHRVTENPPPMDLEEDAGRVASAAAFLNFHGFPFDYAQLPDDVLEEYHEQLGRLHIREYRDA